MSDDPLLRLRQLLDQTPHALQAQRFGESLQRARQAVQSADSDIARFQGALGLARRLRLQQDAAIRANLEAIAEAFDEVGAILESDTGSFDGVAQQAGASRQALRALEATLADKLTAQCQRDFQPLETLGQILARIQETEQLGRRMCELAETALARVRGINPSHAQAFIDEVYAERTALAVQRRALLTGGGVERFFEALADNSATLAHLTPEVLKRLEELGALDAFAVRPL